MSDFHRTGMGQKFYTSDVPRIADALEKIARHLDAKPAEEKPVVEQVWVVHHLDTRQPVDSFAVYASEERCRAALRDTWQGQDHVLAAHWLTKLGEWDGQSTTVIGAYRVSVATVQL